MSIRFLALVGIVAALFTLDLRVPRPAAAAPVGTVTAHLVGARQPTRVTLGPDGNVWFVSESSNAIGRVTPAGEVSRYTDPGIHDLRDIVAGPDGNVWFTNGRTFGVESVGSVGRITPAGVITLFESAELWTPGSIAPAPDGTLWFVDGGWCAGSDGCSYGGLWRVSTSGVISKPLLRDGAGNLTPPPDVYDLEPSPTGSLWISSWGGDLHRVDTGNFITTYPGVATAPSALVPTPDGRVWFAQCGQGTVGVLAPDGTTSYYPLGTTACSYGMAVGPDGAVWATLRDDGLVARIAADGSVETHPVAPDAGEGPGDIAPGADGNVWFTRGDPSPAATGTLERMAPDGASSLVATHTLGRLHLVAPRSGGGAWFTTGSGIAPPEHGTVGRLDADGDVTVIDDPAVDLPVALVAGPDGDEAWILRRPTGTSGSSAGNSLARISADGSVTTWDLTATGRVAEGLTIGADGRPWFGWRSKQTPVSEAGLGRIDERGAIELHPLGMAPHELTAAIDGSLWFGVDAPLGSTQQIHRYRSDGTVEAHATATTEPIRELAGGTDGSIWYRDNHGSVGRVTPDGQAAPLVEAFVTDIEAAADGRLWAVKQMYWGPFWQSWSDLMAVGTDGSLTAIKGPDVTDAWDLRAGPDGDLWLTDQPRGSIISVGTGVARPSVPSGVALAPGAVDGAVEVSWSAPVSDGGRPLTGYRVTASPGGATCDATLPTTGCTVEDLVAGVDYTFTVTATNAGGLSSTSDPAGPVQPPRAPGSGYTPVSPLRVGDTRVGSNVGFTPGPIKGGTSKTLAVAGIGGVPDSARAVVATVTVTNPTAASYLTAYPTGRPVPGTANLLFAPGQTAAQSVTIPIGPDGDVSFFNQLGDVDVVVDVVGFFDDGTAPAGRLNATSPTRVLDSRTTDGTTTGPGQWNGQPLGPDETRSLSLAGAVPATATAAVVNLTVTAGSDPSYLRALPGGATRAQTATALFAPGQTITTLTTVGLGPDQTIDLYNQQGNVHVVADLVGWYDPTTGDLFHPLTPRRLHDTRVTTPLGPDETRTLDATVNDLGIPALPADATAVAGTLTATGATAPSYLSAGPTPLPHPPGTATLLTDTGQTIPNTLTTGTGQPPFAGPTPHPSLDLFNQNGTVHSVVDVSGYYSPS